MTGTKVWWDDLYTLFGIFSLIVALIVYLWLIVAAYWYRKKKGEKPPRDSLKAGVFPHERGNTKVEVSWTLLSFLLVLGLTLISVQPLQNLMTPPGDCQRTADSNTVCVHVVGYQWGWNYEITYPGDTRLELGKGTSMTLVEGGSVTYSNGTTVRYPAGEVLTFSETTRIVFPFITYVKETTTLDLPCGKDIVFILDSDDVIHAWWVPEYGVKADAIKNRQQTIWFHAGRAGTFRAPCAEYCGDGHTYMVGFVKISPADPCSAAASGCC